MSEWKETGLIVLPIRMQIVIVGRENAQIEKG